MRLETQKGFWEFHMLLVYLLTGYLKDCMCTLTINCFVMCEVLQLGMS